MTDKEIIIHGVNVSGCSYYNPLGNYNCGGTKKCSQWSNCYYKQLSRKTAECEKSEQALNEIEKYFLKQCGIHKATIGNHAVVCNQCEIKKNLDIISKAKDGKNE